MSYIYIYIYDISSLRVKWQVINLRCCCILLVDSVQRMMMHGIANPKSLFSSMVVKKNTCFLTSVFEHARVFPLHKLNPASANNRS